MMKFWLKANYMGRQMFTWKNEETGELCQNIVTQYELCVHKKITAESLTVILLYLTSNNLQRDSSFEKERIAQQTIIMRMFE